MRKLLLAVSLAVLVVAFASGCCSQESGSREFIPGKGWVPS